MAYYKSKITGRESRKFPVKIEIAKDDIEFLKKIAGKVDTEGFNEYVQTVAQIGVDIWVTNRREEVNKGITPHDWIKQLMEIVETLGKRADNARKVEKGPTSSK